MRSQNHEKDPLAAWRPTSVAILVSINRLGTWTLGYVLPNEFRAGGFQQHARPALDQRDGILSSKEND